MQTWVELLEEAKNAKHIQGKGCISISSLPFLQHCGGRFKAEEGLPDSNSDASLNGTAAHYCVERDILPKDTPLEYIEKIAWVKAAIKMFINDGWELFGHEVYFENETYSGTVDMVMKKPGQKIYLIIDFKFGSWWVKDDTPQLTGYARMGYTEYEAEEIYTCILQPEQNKFLPIKRSVDQVWKEIHDIRETVLADKRTPSDLACTFCKAFATDRCPETQKQLATQISSEAVTKESFMKFYPVLSSLERAIKKFKENAKEFALNGGDTGEYELVEVAGKREIKDAEAAFHAIKDFVDPQALREKLKISCGALEELLIDAKQVEKKKDAPDMLESILGGELTYSNPTMQLKKRKKDKA